MKLARLVVPTVLAVTVAAGIACSDDESTSTTATGTGTGAEIPPCASDPGSDRCEPCRSQAGAIICFSIDCDYIPDTGECALA